MKRLTLILSFVLTGILAQAQEEQGVTLTVTIENISSDEGHILASLHTSETFMRGPGVKAAQEKSKTGALTLTFEDVKPGTYAIMAIQDANDNRQMDFDENGMPKENYGMSGNDMVMGPPDFETAKFEVTDTDQEFKIRF